MINHSTPAQLHLLAQIAWCAQPNAFVTGADILITFMSNTNTPENAQVPFGFVFVCAYIVICLWANHLDNNQHNR